MPPHFMLVSWGTDLELCSLEVCHVLAVFLSRTYFLGPLHSSTEGGAAIVSHQSRFFFSEHLWVEERWEVTPVQEGQMGQAPGLPFLIF